MICQMGALSLAMLQLPHPSASASSQVYWHKKMEKWRATCKVGGTWTHLGYFSSEDAAARRFDEAASAQGLPLNFPLRPGDPAAPRGGGRGVSAYTGVYRRKDKWQAKNS